MKKCLAKGRELSPRIYSQLRWWLWVIVGREKFPQFARCIVCEVLYYPCSMVLGQFFCRFTGSVAQTHCARQASSAHQWEIFGGRNFRGNKFSRAGVWSWKSRKLLPRGNFPLYGICNCVSNSWNVPSLKLSPNFCTVLLVIFRYIAGTCVSTILACSDFTSSSWLHSEVFPTKLSLTVIAWTLQVYKMYHTESTLQHEWTLMIDNAFPPCIVGRSFVMPHWTQHGC